MTHAPVDPERRRAIDDLFDGAVDQPRDQRSAWLSAQCSDESLRAEVEALLAAHDITGGLLDQNALELALPLLDAPRIDRQIGPYRVLRELGRGGMGVVYLAERADGQYRQRVAIKLLRASADTEELHRRFVAERQILASLSHPNIAQLVDGGVTEAHLPYLVMEYVDGLPITAYCDRQRLTIEERLQLFHDVCAAVHHAHQNLVIHRDIKPSNILVTDDRRVKLLDFGIAKLLNPTLGPDDVPLTRTECRVMTPEYASPEQIRGESLTTASDVYALGVMLYELLCGRRPHRLTSKSPQELEDIVVRRQPVPPSVAAGRPEPARTEAAAPDANLEEIAANRRVTVERLRRRLRGDLDAIVMMALRKESARRYGSADLLWEDVQRHLDGLPVLADRGTHWYRARKFLARHRIQATAAALITVSLVVGTSVAVRQAAVANRERDRARQALRQSNEVSDFLVRLFRTPAPPGATREQVMARDMLVTGTARIEELAGQPVVQAQMLDALGRVNEQLGRFDDAEQMLRRALQIRRRQFGDTSVDVAATLRNLSSVLRQRGRAAEALRASSEALAMQQRVLGPRHPDVALTLMDVATLTDETAVAESLYRAARDIQIAALGREHPDVATTDYWLAMTVRERGAYAEAESLLRESLAARERQLGPEHPAVVIGLLRLASHLQSYGNRPAAAESLYLRALAIVRKRPNQEVRLLANVLSSLTALSATRGDYVRAEAFGREALDAQRRSVGSEHPLATENMALLARQLAGQGRYREADAMLRDAVAIIERTLGPQHSRVSELLLPLAAVHAAAGRRDEAESDLRRALAILERAEGVGPQSVAQAAALLADVIAQRGDSVESDALFDRAAPMLRSSPPRVGPDIRAAYGALAKHYRAKNSPGDADYFRKLAQGGSPWGVISPVR